MFREKFFQKLWEDISCQQSEREKLKQAIDKIPPNFTLRRFAALYPLELLKNEHRRRLESEILQVWHQYGPFAQVPVRHAFTIASYVASHVYEQRPLRVAVKEMMKHLVIRKKNHFLIQSLLHAHVYNFEFFLQSIPTYIKIYSNFKTTKDNYIVVEKKDNHHYIFQIKSDEALIRSYLLPGLFEGFLKLFKVSGNVTPELLSDQLLEISIAWK